MDFFQEIRESGLPLLLVFYSFDRLPKHFRFDSIDLSFLRKMNEDPKLGIYYLIVSRRPLMYIEKLHNLAPSYFSTIFLPPYRVGLLSEEETKALIKEPAQPILLHSPWDDWLAESIFEWGGRHPCCIRHICSELFERIWNQGEQFRPSDANRIASELGNSLRFYFDRLYVNLANDGLILPLVRTVESGYIGSHFSEVQELLDLGYFLPELAREGRYQLFSPLFHNYLVWRGDLRLPPPPFPSPPVPPMRPKVEKILNLERPLPDIRLWFEDYQREHTRIAVKPDVDSYVLLFLTGCTEKLTEEELMELRLHLFFRYRDDCEERGDRRKVDVLRTYFYAECKRWRQRFEKEQK
ncbi:MAG: hypothetical protein HYR94_14005 [Chloroflexi bacterium]|nr:hypothetical protein [Chloroflexota bacterium]